MQLVAKPSSLLECAQLPLPTHHLPPVERASKDAARNSTELGLCLRKASVCVEGQQYSAQVAPVCVNRHHDTGLSEPVLERIGKDAPCLAVEMVSCAHWPFALVDPWLAQVAECRQAGKSASRMARSRSPPTNSSWVPVGSSKNDGAGVAPTSSRIMPMAATNESRRSDDQMRVSLMRTNSAGSSGLAAPCHRRTWRQGQHPAARDVGDLTREQPPIAPLPPRRHTRRLPHNALPSGALTSDRRVKGACSGGEVRPARVLANRVWPRWTRWPPVTAGFGHPESAHAKVGRRSGSRNAVVCGIPRPYSLAIPVAAQWRDVREKGLPKWRYPPAKCRVAS